MNGQTFKLMSSELPKISVSHSGSQLESDTERDTIGSTTNPKALIMTVATFLFAMTTFASVAQAAPKQWSLKKGMTAQYQVKTIKAAKDKERDLLMPAGIPVTDSDIENGIRLNFKAKDLQNVIFRQILSLPSEIKKKGECEVSDSVNAVGNHTLNIAAKGKVKTKVSGRKVKLQGQMTLSQGADSSRAKVKSGSLNWIAVFDSRKGVFLSANYEFSIKYSYDNNKGKVSQHAFVSQGQVQLTKISKLVGKEYRSGLAKAIAKGADWLKKKTPARTKGKNMGFIALNVFALLRSGVSPNEPEIVAAFEKLEQLDPARTYDVSMYILALEAKTVRRFPPKGQRSVPRYERGRVAKADAKKIQSLANWLISARITGHGRWDYTPYSSEGTEGKAPESARYDNSVTQFAVLALHAAHRVGAKIDHVVWKEIFNHFLNSQSGSVGAGVHTIGRSDQLSKKEEKIGSGMKSVERSSSGTEGAEGVEYRGWSYTANGGAYGSMTNAGLSSVAIAADMLKAAGKFPAEWEGEFQRMVAEGLSWQAKHYTVKSNPGKSGEAWHYYYLYSLEKACELLDVESFDGHSWHDEGSKYLIAVQQPSGSWHNQDRDTALALLFLNRATLKTTVNILKRRNTTGGGDSPRDMAVVYIEAAKGEVSLNNLLKSMVDASTSKRRKMQKWFKQGLEQLTDVQRPVIMPALIAMLGFKDTKRFARKHLRQITRDSSIREASGYEQWHTKWQILHKAGFEHRFQDIPKMRAALEDKNVLIRKQAMLSAIRLRAVELVPDVANLIDKPHDKDTALECLAILSSSKLESKEQAQEWADRNMMNFLKDEKASRQIYLAIYGSKSARKKVVAAGKKHLEQLAQLASKSAYANGAMSILQEITGQRFPNAEKWQKWLADNAANIQANGRLKESDLDD